MENSPRDSSSLSEYWISAKARKYRTTPLRFLLPPLRRLSYPDSPCKPFSQLLVLTFFSISILVSLFITQFSTNGFPQPSLIRYLIPPRSFLLSLDPFYRIRIHECSRCVAREPNALVETKDHWPWGGKNYLNWNWSFPIGKEGGREGEGRLCPFSVTLR